MLLTLVLFTVVFLDNRYRVLPTSIHNHLPAHHPGFVVTDLTVVTCSSLNPFSSCTKDGEYWHRINKDLYLGKGYITKAYLLVERKRESDLKPHEEVIHDIKIGRIQPSAVDPLSKDERWESRPAGMWVKKSAKRTDESKIVTGVDVLFGADAADPRSNWAVQDISLFIDGGSDAPEPR